MRLTSSFRVSEAVCGVKCWMLCVVPGASLYEILEAGEWSSPAFMKYLDYHRLEAEVVLQAHVDESDDED